MNLLRTLSIAFVFSVIAFNSATAGSIGSAAYDVSATYEFRKSLGESGPAFTGDTAWNVCEEKWRDYLPDCETDVDCQELHDEDPSIGQVCWNGGCTPKGHYITARDMCLRRWDRRDSASSPDFGTSYGLKMTMASEGKTSPGGSQHVKSRIKSVLDFTAHIFGASISMGELHFKVKNTRNGAAEISAWFEGLFGIKRGEKTWTIEGNNEIREVSKEKPKSINKCTGFNFLLVRFHACAEVRAVFRMDATVETGTGAAVTINAVPTLAVEAEVSVEAEAGLDAVASASASTGGTLQLVSLQFPLRASIDGQDSELKAGLVAQGLAGRIWTEIDGSQEILWNFGDKPIEPEGILFEMSPDSPLMNLIWDEEDIF